MRKLSFLSSTIESTFSSIINEKGFLERESRILNLEFDLLEKQLCDIKNKLENNENYLSELKISTDKVNENKYDIEQMIIKKGQFFTARSSIIRDLKIMHLKYNHLKNDFLVINEYNEKEIFEIKNIVQLIFNAQRKFFEL